MSNPHLRIGRVNDYEWMTLRTGSDQIFSLLKTVPELVMGHLVGITSFDSGPLTPSKEERRLGWESIGNVLWTDPVTDSGLLPTGGYDEWYICDLRIDLTRIEVFVNYGNWSLEEPIGVATEMIRANPTWDRLAIEADSARQAESLERFWNQIQSVNPVSFVAQGDNLNLVTKDTVVFEKARQWAANRV